MGFTPQVVDFNGDGREDILTGSYSPGHLYLFARNEDGTFAEAEKLKYDNGDLIEHRASTPFAVDWDKDGDLDLLCGDIQGHAWLMENTKEGFKRGVKLQAEGKDLKADHGDSQPVASDWNGDGVLDIVFPHGNGKVELYPGEATKEGIKLGAPETLVEAFNREAEGVRPGMRAKVCVTDVNGDGAMDLLLGDYETIQLPAPELTEEEKAEFETLKKERDANTKEMMDIINKVREELLKEFDAESMDDLTEEQKKQFNEKYIKGIRENPEYLEIGKKNREIYEKIRKYQGGYERRGNVWLFQQKVKSPTTGNAEG